MFSLSSQIDLLAFSTTIGLVMGALAFFKLRDLRNPSPNATQVALGVGVFVTITGAYGFQFFRDPPAQPTLLQNIVGLSCLGTYIVMGFWATSWKMSRRDREIYDISRRYKGRDDDASLEQMMREIDAVDDAQLADLRARAPASRAAARELARLLDGQIAAYGKIPPPGQEGSAEVQKAFLTRISDLEMERRWCDRFL